MAEGLEKRSPQSEYVPKLRDALFVAYRQANANDKALALAEKIIAAGQPNEDMLLVAIDAYSQQKKEPEKIHTYGARIVETMNSKAKPEGMSDADWTNRKNLFVGLAHYLSGKQYELDSKHALADTELRAALPLVENNANLKPEVLFLIGQANYKMDKVQEAVNYFRQCAALASPYKAQATKNVQVIQTQYRGVK